MPGNDKLQKWVEVFDTLLNRGRRQRLSVLFHDYGLKHGKPKANQLLTRLIDTRINDSLLNYLIRPRPKGVKYRATGSWIDYAPLYDLLKESLFERRPFPTGLRRSRDHSYRRIG